MHLLAQLGGGVFVFVATIPITAIAGVVSGIMSNQLFARVLAGLLAICLLITLLADRESDLVLHYSFVPTCAGMGVDWCWEPPPAWRSYLT